MKSFILLHSTCLKRNCVIFHCHIQDPAPMTEDMLEEHAEVLANLGTTVEGAELRAKMQSACLLSDMEAFKVSVYICTRPSTYDPGSLTRGKTSKLLDHANFIFYPPLQYLIQRLVFPSTQWPYQ